MTNVSPRKETSRNANSISPRNASIEASKGAKGPRAITSDPHKASPRRVNEAYKLNPRPGYLEGDSISPRMREFSMNSTILNFEFQARHNTSIHSTKGAKSSRASNRRKITSRGGGIINRGGGGRPTLSPSIKRRLKLPLSKLNSF